MSDIKSTVTAISAFNDNYIWAITHENSDKIAFVDPGDAAVCLEFMQSHQLTLCAILITHHHHDHTGGIKALLAYAKQQGVTVTVYGPENSAIENINLPVTEQDEVVLSELHCQFSVLALPGHTLDHIAYVNDELVFCGDTLFSGGCGRLFEGSAEQMQHSLAKLVSLPNETLVYCAHEYTQANLKFAQAIEADNKNLQQYALHVDNLRKNGRATIPSNIGLEKQINPFLRCQQPQVQKSAEHYKKVALCNEVEVFAAIRAWKNTF